MELTQSVRLVRLPEVERRVGYRKSKIFGAVATGAFPQPVRLGRVVAWVEGELDAWINARSAERDARAAPRRRSP